VPLAAGALDGAFLVLLCDVDDALAAALDARARVGEFLLAAMDSDRGTIEMPAVVRRGRLQIAVSTSGAAPGLSARLRQSLEKLFPQRIGAWVERLATLRESLRSATPEERRERMKRAVADVAIEGQLKMPE